MENIRLTNHANLTPPPAGENATKHLTWKTIVMPLLFILMHFLFSQVIATIFLFVMIVIQSAAGGTDILALLQDTDALNNIITSNYPIITSILSVALIPICLVYLKQTGKRDPRVWMPARPRAAELLASLVLMIGSLGVINIWFNLLFLLQDSLPPIKLWMDDYLASSEAFSPDVGYFWLILGVSILTPVLEELIFRGVVQGELRKAMPEWAAIVIQAVLFAAYHMQPIQSSYVLLPGLLLGLAYYWTRSIWVPIAMHCLFNFIGSALPLLIGDSQAGQEILGYAEMAFIVLGIAAGIYLFIKHRRRQPATPAAA